MHAFTLLRRAFVACALLLAATSQAHTPYLSPTSFEPVMGKMITLDASFAERFYIPESAFNNSDFLVIGPDGKSSAPDTLSELKTRTVIEHELSQEGTYRFTTGARLGATFLIYDLNGEEKRAMNPKDPLPDAAKVKMHFRSVTRSDVYVSQKKINHTAIRVDEEGLQLLPKTHPNELFAAEPFNLQVLFNGQPLANSKLMVYPAKGAEDVEPQEFTSDNNGNVALNLAAGRYLVRARHRASAPSAAEVPIYSHTTTLSLLVFAND
ncbi:DUF4198 domain-containing protein [Halioxenophilus aromaticivorans]|uniref:DUF4198 domain-containing protein n=1 Tax=Halioxenophilus aromaticivorans TaxID=1306992 RepID=A0AAV3U4I4_9ALTE